MYSIPSGFAESLRVQLDGRFRVRFSRKVKRFQLEEKLQCAILPPIYVAPDDDDTIRAIDGYGFFAEVSPGTLTPCSRCGKDRHTAFKEFMATACEHCGDKDSGAVHWPLDDSLLEHLRKTDPRRGAHERFKSMRGMNEKRKQLELASTIRESSARGVDDAKFTIPKVSLTGATNFWLGK